MMSHEMVRGGGRRRAMRPNRKPIAAPLAWGLPNRVERPEPSKCEHDFARYGSKGVVEQCVLCNALRDVPQGRKPCDACGPDPIADRPCIACGQ